MVAIIIAIRDFLIAAALAWVGVTIEPQTSPERCSGDACEQAVTPRGR